MEKTITEVSETTGIPKRTLADAAKEGRLPARLVGPIWLVDTANPLYQNFLANHQQWRAVRGKGKDKE